MNCLDINFFFDFKLVVWLLIYLVVFYLEVVMDFVEYMKFCMYYSC